MDERTALEKRVAELEKKLSDAIKRIGDLEGANEILGKRVLDAINDMKTRNVLA